MKHKNVLVIMDLLPLYLNLKLVNLPFICNASTIVDVRTFNVSLLNNTSEKHVKTQHPCALAVGPLAFVCANLTTLELFCSICDKS